MVVHIHIHVTPGAKHPGIGGRHGDRLIVRVRQRAVDGDGAAALAARTIADRDIIGAGLVGAECVVADRGILAAGAVVWRYDKDGQVLVLLIHRPRYDDWSIPKGKVDPGETFLQAAIREAKEETTVT